jgi:3-phosphoshikimate 1-carboxyvinyltransferase
MNGCDQQLVLHKGAQIGAALLNKLKSYVTARFRYEESLMQMRGYQGFEHHEKQHSYLESQVAALQTAQSTGSGRTPESLLPFLRDWFLNHILEHDKRITRYAKWVWRIAGPGPGRERQSEQGERSSRIWPHRVEEDSSEKEITRHHGKESDMKFIVKRSSLKGTIRIPGNKSATARAIVLGALAEGVSRVHNPLPGVDSFSIVDMMRALGAKIDTSRPDLWVFNGLANRPQVPACVLDAGNSGTGYYLLTAVGALIDGCSVITGDYQICRRPAQPLIDALNDLGARVFSTRNCGTAPLVIRGPLKGGKTKLPGVNSQWLSPLLIAGALTPEGVTVMEDNLMERPYVDMTMGWIKLAGGAVTHRHYEAFTIPGGQKYRGFKAEIPADWGSSGYPMVGAAISDSKVTFLGMDPDDYAGERMYPHIIKEMGGNVTFGDGGKTVTVEGGNELHGTEIDCAGTPDAVPALAVLGCKAKGKTVLKNIEASRFKETDRTRSIMEELTKMGGRFEETPHSLTIYQSDLKGAHIDGRHDHRIVMATAIGAMMAEGETIIDDAEYTKVSFPNFYEVCASLGADIQRMEKI